MGSRSIVGRFAAVAAVLMATVGALILSSANTVEPSRIIIAGEFNEDICMGRGSTFYSDEQGRVWEWRPKQGPVVYGDCRDWEWVRVR